MKHLTLLSLLGLAICVGCAQANQSARLSFLEGLGKQSAATDESKFPEDGVMAWARERNKAATTPETVTEMLVKNGQVAHGLLTNPHESKQRQGLRLSQFTAQVALERLPDKTIAARFYQLFVLPHLNVAHKERWQDLSRQRLLEESIGAFQAAKDQKQIEATYRLLLKEELNLNTRDWVRGELAQVLAARGEYKEAISLLQAIESRSIVQVKKLIPQYEKELAKQSTPAKQSPTKP